MSNNYHFHPWSIESSKPNISIGFFFMWIRKYHNLVTKSSEISSNRKKGEKVITCQKQLNSTIIHQNGEMEWKGITLGITRLIDLQWHRLSAIIIDYIIWCSSPAPPSYLEPAHTSNINLYLYFVMKYFLTSLQTSVQKNEGTKIVSC